MRLILDMDSTRRALTGIGWYAVHLARHLPEVSDSLEVLAWRGGRVMPAASCLDASATSSSKRVPASAPFKLDIPALKLIQQRMLSTRQSRVLQSYPDAIFHGTNFQVPRHAGPTVCTIHDLSTYRFPHHHPRQRVSAITRAIEDAARTADHLLTISEFSRRELVDLLGIEESRISVTHLAARAGFEPRSSEQTAASLQHFGLSYGSYTLHVGTIEPRKNIDTLLDAYSCIDHSLRLRFPLVLAGSPGWHSTALHDRISKYQSEGWLKYLGYVAEHQLLDLYAGATVFVSCSLYEGFGLPLVEAMACGIPVIASDIGTFIEVAGDAAQFFALNDATALRHSLEMILTDDAARRRFASCGLERVSRYSWQRTAQQTLDVYRAISR